MSNVNDFVIENGVLKEYTGSGGDVVIPVGVTSIGDHAFHKWHSRVTSITIPDSVTDVGISAFADCVSLQSVTVKSSKITFGLTVFQYCMELKTVVLEVVPSAEFNLSVFPNKAKFILPPHILQTKEILPPLWLSEQRSLLRKNTLMLQYTKQLSSGWTYVGLLRIMPLRHYPTLLGFWRKKCQR